MFAFFVRGQKREDDKMEEGEEAMGRVEDEAEGIEANQTLSRHLQFFQWEWALLRNRELVSWKAYLIKWDLWDDYVTVYFSTCTCQWKSIFVVNCNFYGDILICILNQGQGSSIPDYGASGTRDSHPGVKIKKEGYNM